MIEKVAFAGCRIDGQVFTAYDHYSAFVKAMETGIVNEEDFLGPRHEEGFVTNTGKWLNREEAFVLGKKNNQILKPSHKEEWLDAFDCEFC